MDLLEQSMLKAWLTRLRDLIDSGHEGTRQAQRELDIALTRIEEDQALVLTVPKGKGDNNGNADMGRETNQSGEGTVRDEEQNGQSDGEVGSSREGDKSRRGAERAGPESDAESDTTNDKSGEGSDGDKGQTEPSQSG